MSTVYLVRGFFVSLCYSLCGLVCSLGCAPGCLCVIVSRRGCVCVADHTIGGEPGGLKQREPETNGQRSRLREPEAIDEETESDRDTQTDTGREINVYMC